MRNIPNDASLSRTIQARLRIDDERVRFDAQLMPEITERGGTVWLSNYDADGYEGGILRVSNEGGHILYQYAQNEVFPAWSYLVDIFNLNTSSDSKPGLYGGRMFYRGLGGTIVYRDFNGVNFGAEVNTSVAVSEFCGFAPVSATELYMLSKDTNESSGTRNVYKIAHVDIQTGVSIYWQGRVYNAHPRYFDAVRLDNADYLYLNEMGGRGMYLKRSGMWGELKPIITMDVIDDLFSFYPGLASVINGKAFITGVMTRGATMTPLHIYMIGPEQPTLGRDMFIWKGLPTRTLYGTWAINPSQPKMGKLHLVGNEVWYLGVGILGKAPATSLFGVDNPEKMLTTAPASVRLGTMSSQPFMLTAELDGNLSHPALKAGARAILDVAVNNIWSTVGTFSIDALVKPRGESGRSQTIVARSAAMKKLSQWESDAPFDYWSQTKQSSNPADMAEVVRARGMWRNVNGALSMERLNEDGFMYLTAKSCRNGEVRGHFKKVAGDFDMRFGVGLNYWTEGKYEAATRLGIDAYEVKDEHLLNYGLFAVYGSKEVNGAPGIKVYQVVGNVFEPLSNGAGSPLQVSVDFGSNTYYWLSLTFTDGRIKVAHRNGTTWTTDIDDVPVYYSATLPWHKDQIGRAAFYAKNVTPSSMCYPLSSTDMKLYLEDISDFPASETLLINEEQVKYSGKSSLQSAVSVSTETPARVLSAKGISHSWITHRAV